MRIKIIIFFFIAALFATAPLSAQGFLNKLKKTVEKVDKKVKEGKDKLQKGENRDDRNSSSGIGDGNVEIDWAAEGILRKEINGIPLGNYGFKGTKPRVIPDCGNAINKECQEFGNTRFGSFYDGVAIVKDRLRTSVINKKGETVFTFQDILSRNGYDTSCNIPNRFFDGRVMLLVDKKEGDKTVLCAIIVNTRGDIIKEFKQVCGASQFIDGTAILITDEYIRHKENKKEISFIDINGMRVFDELSSAYVGPFFSTVRPFDSLTKMYMALGKTNFYPYPALDENGNMQWGGRDRNGKQLCPPKYSVVWGGRDGMMMFQDQESNRFGFVNDKGEEIVAAKFSKRPKSFMKGLALVENAERDYFFLDKKGNIQPMPFEVYQDEISSMTENGYYLMTSRESANPFVNTNWDEDYFNVGYIVKNNDGKFQRVAATKAVGSLSDFDDALVYSEVHMTSQNDMFWIRNEKVYDVIDTAGNLVYTNLGSTFSDGLALVALDKNKIGYMTPEGKVVLTFSKPSF